MIIAAFVFAVMGLTALEQQIWEDARSISQRVSALRNSPEVEAAGYARLLHQQLAIEEAFLYTAAPDNFDPIWLTTILWLDTDHMTTINFNGQNILLTGIVYELEVIEAFRQDLVDTEVFEYVGLGRIRSHGAEQFSYELRLTTP